MSYGQDYLSQLMDELRQARDALSRHRNRTVAIEHLRQAIVVLDSGCGGLKASVVRENIVAALRSLGGEG